MEAKKKSYKNLSKILVKKYIEKLRRQGRQDYVNQIQNHKVRFDHRNEYKFDMGQNHKDIDSGYYPKSSKWTTDYDRDKYDDK